MRDRPKGFSEAIDEIEKTIAKIKPHIDEVKSKVSDEFSQTKDKVEEQVQKNPWAAVGIVALVFFLLGFLFNEKRSRRSD